MPEKPEHIPVVCPTCGKTTYAPSGAKQVTCEGVQDHPDPRMRYNCGTVVKVEREE